MFGQPAKSYLSQTTRKKKQLRLCDGFSKTKEDTLIILRQKLLLVIVDLTAIQYREKGTLETSKKSWINSKYNGSKILAGKQQRKCHVGRAPLQLQLWNGGSFFLMILQQAIWLRLRIFNNCLNDLKFDFILYWKKKSQARSLLSSDAQHEDKV